MRVNSRKNTSQEGEEDLIAFTQVVGQEGSRSEIRFIDKLQTFRKSWRYFAEITENLNHASIMLWVCHLGCLSGNLDRSGFAARHARALARE